MTVKMERVFARPNKNTFNIPPIRALIEEYIYEGYWIDPFVRNSVFKGVCTATNDLDPSIRATKNLKATTFCEQLREQFKGRWFDGVLFVPPYSPRQVKESYNGIGLEVFKEDTQAKFHSDPKNSLTEILRPGARAITFGWDSNGFGKIRGFELERILLVAHGSKHHDTIVTVERKV